jgi:hypothetical protein
MNERLKSDSQKEEGNRVLVFGCLVYVPRLDGAGAKAPNTSAISPTAAVMIMPIAASCNPVQTLVKTFVAVVLAEPVKWREPTALWKLATINTAAIIIIARAIIPIMSPTRTQHSPPPNFFRKFKDKRKYLKKIKLFSMLFPLT